MAISSFEKISISYIELKIILEAGSLQHATENRRPESFRQSLREHRNCRAKRASSKGQGVNGQMIGTRG